MFLFQILAALPSVSSILWTGIWWRFRELKSLLWSLSLKNGSINPYFCKVSCPVWPGSHYRPATSFLWEGYSLTGSWLLKRERHASHIPFIWRSPFGMTLNSCWRLSRFKMVFLFLYMKHPLTLTLMPILTGGFKTHQALVPIITCSTNTILCSPVHFHQVHISDLELLACVLVARVWGTQFVSQHIQIFHKFIMTTELNPPGSTKANCLVNAYSRTADPKCQQIIQNFTNKHRARPTQRHIPPEMFSLAKSTLICY